MCTRKTTFALMLFLLGSHAHAESHPTINRFFGFDMILTPVAINWACRGEADDGDLRVIEELIEAFPDDAENADLPNIIEELVRVVQTETAIADLIGGELDEPRRSELCDFAAPLTLNWATAEHLETGDGEMPISQRDAWTAFFQFVERL